MDVHAFLLLHFQVACSPVFAGAPVVQKVGEKSSKAAWKSSEKHTKGYECNKCMYLLMVCFRPLVLVGGGDARCPLHRTVPENGSQDIVAPKDGCRGSQKV